MKIYPIERNCAMVGGICVHRTDCAEGTSVQGLCGRSRHLGVECCYSGEFQRQSDRGYNNINNIRFSSIFQYSYFAADNVR